MRCDFISNNIDNKKIEIINFDNNIYFNPYDIARYLSTTEFTIRSQVFRLDENYRLKFHNLNPEHNKIRNFNNKGETFITKEGLIILLSKLQDSNSNEKSHLLEVLEHDYSLEFNYSTVKVDISEYKGLEIYNKNGIYFVNPYTLGEILNLNKRGVQS